jgi:hypothetical protein
LTPILTHHSNITGRSLASEHLPRCSCLPASTVSLKCYHDCLVRHTPRPHRARISFPTVQLFTSIARRSDTIFPRPVPFRLGHFGAVPRIFLLMYHHLFSCIAGRFLVLFFISFSFPRQYPVLGISHLPLHEALLVRSLIIRSCCAVLTFRRIIRLFFRTISFFLTPSFVLFHVSQCCV